MLTKRFALDKKGKRIYIGTLVEYKNSLFYVENMNYLMWTKKQFITLRSKKNKNKILDFITPEEVAKRENNY